jgi:uncharacterized membrane protein YfcA
MNERYFIMSWQDFVNGSYETLGGLFVLLSILKLYKEKKVRGIHVLNVLFFATWGYWNLYYYRHLNQWISLIGGIGVTFTNTIWFSQIIYYSYMEKKHQKNN